MYPADKKRPNGKLRVLYECAPLAMIVEQAGGEATTGIFREECTRLMDIEPKTIHETCPIVVACTRDMNKLRETYENSGFGVRFMNVFTLRSAHMNMYYCFLCVLLLAL